MATFRIKIDERTRTGKAILELVYSISKESNAIELIAKTESKDEYGEDFLKMVIEATKSKNRTKIDPNNLWESIQ